MGDWYRYDRSGAVERYCDRDVEIVDNAVAVQISESKIRSKNYGSGAKDIDFAVGKVVLKFPSDVQGVLP
jgi:hypothetical protein